MTAPRRIGVGLGLTIAAQVSGCGKALPEGLFSVDGLRIGALVTTEDQPSLEQRGIELAVAEINAEGGVLGKPLLVEFEDDDANAETSLDKAKDLYRKGVDVFIGPGFSSGFLRVARECAIPAGIPLLSFSATSPSVASLVDEDLVSRTVPSDSFQGSIAARVAHGEYARSKVSIVYVDTAYGQGLAASFAGEFASLGGTVVKQQAMPELDEAQLDAFDFGAIAAQAFEGDPDLLYLVTYAEDGARLTQALREPFLAREARPLVMGADGNADDAFFAAADPEVVKDMIGTRPGQNVVEANYAAFLERFKARFGIDGSPFAATAYDATYLTALAATAAGKKNGRSIAAWIRPSSKGGERFTSSQYREAVRRIEVGAPIDYVGVSGEIDLDDNGDPESGYYEIWQNLAGAPAQQRTIPYP